MEEYLHTTIGHFRPYLMAVMRKVVLSLRPSIRLGMEVLPGKGHSAAVSIVPYCQTSGEILDGRQQNDTACA